MEGSPEATQSDFACVASDYVVPPFGMSNPSKANRCYVNALVQCLLHLRCLPLPPLSGTCLAESAVMWRSLVALYSEAIKGEGAKNAPVLSSSKELLSLVGVPGEQQDAHELFMVLVGQLDKEALSHKRGKKKKPAKKSGGGGFTEVAKSGKAVVVQTLGTQDETVGPVTKLFSVLLSTAKSNKKTLEPSCGISLELSDDWAKTAQSWKFQELPPVLCVHLMMDSDDRGMLCKSHVDCEQVLSARELELLEAKSGKKKTYRLTSVLLHAGESLFRGHYAARLLSEKEGLWMGRNDSKCVTFENLTDNLHPFCPYLFFYKQVQ